jgi:hypothetical protein
MSDLTYARTHWVDDTVPAINALNLNNIEKGIDDATNSLNAKVSSEVTEAGASRVPNMVWMTQLSYDNLTPIDDTLYIIVE